jgi:hypothetical protein
VVALLLQSVAAERDQPEQRVVVLAVDPHLIGQRRTHASAAATAVAAVAAGRHEFLVAFIGDLGEVRIRAFQFALGGAFGGCRRRSGSGFAARRGRALLRGRFRLLRGIVRCERGTDKAKAEDGGEGEGSKHWGPP